MITSLATKRISAISQWQIFLKSFTHKLAAKASWHRNYVTETPRIRVDNNRAFGRLLRTRMSEIIVFSVRRTTVVATRRRLLNGFTSTISAVGCGGGADDRQRYRLLAAAATRVENAPPRRLLP